MKGTLAVARKELLSYFFAPMAYIVIAAFLLMNGFIFSVIMTALSQPGASMSSPLGLFFGGSLFFWLFVIVTVPAITMKLGAEERKTGTMETLLTAPVSDFGVVAGKYLAAMGLYLACWAPTLLYVWVLTRFSQVDWGPVAGGYLGVILLGAFFIAAGLFTSLAARNQLVAAIMAFAILILLLFVSILGFMVTDPLWKSVLEYVDLWSIIQNCGKGLLDSRAVVYLLSGTGLFLALSYEALEAGRFSR